MDIIQSNKNELKRLDMNDIKERNDDIIKDDINDDDIIIELNDDDINYMFESESNDDLDKKDERNVIKNTNNIRSNGGTHYVNPERLQFINNITTVDISNSQLNNIHNNININNNINNSDDREDSLPPIPPKLMEPINNTIIKSIPSIPTPMVPRPAPPIPYHPMYPQSNGIPLQPIPMMPVYQPSIVPVNPLGIQPFNYNTQPYFMNNKTNTTTNNNRDTKDLKKDLAIFGNWVVYFTDDKTPYYYNINTKACFYIFSVFILYIVSMLIYCRKQFGKDLMQCHHLTNGQIANNQKLQKDLITIIMKI